MDVSIRRRLVTVVAALAIALIPIRDRATAVSTNDVAAQFVTAFGERPHAVAVDARGRTYVAGIIERPSTSAGFTDLDVYVARLDAAGRRFEYVRVFGGAGIEAPTALLVDRVGRAIVVGWTSSTTFPVTEGRSSRQGELDGFVARLDVDGTIESSWLFGGSGRDQIHHLAWAPAGGYVIAGQTSSADVSFPPMAVQPTLPGSSGFFVAWFDAADRIEGGTHLPPSSSPHALAVDDHGAAYVAGKTMSHDFPTTPGAFRQGPDFGTCMPGNTEFPCPGGFVVKLGRFGRTLDYAVLFGARRSLSSATGITVDARGRAYVSGEAAASLGPADPGLRGDSDGRFTAILSADGSSFLQVDRAPWSPSTMLDAFQRPIFAGSAGFGFSTLRAVQRRNAGGPLWRTTNSGTHWQFVDTNAELKRIERIYVDPFEPGRIWAATPSGVLTSTDKGTTWQATALSDHVTAFTIAGRSARTLVASTTSRFVRSTDGGRTWRSLLDPFSRPGVAHDGLFTITSDPNVLYAFGQGLAVHRSVDAGASWHPVPGPPWGITAFVAFGSPRLLIAGTYDGLWKSTDEGASWRRVADAAAPVDLVTDPSSAHRVYAATNREILISEDDGDTWARRPGPELDTGFFVTGLKDLLAGLDGTLYVGTSRGLALSRDRGRSWTRTPVRQPVRDIAVDPAQSAHLLAATDVGLDGYVAQTFPGTLQRDFATYLGGAGDDVLIGAGSDGAGHVYVGGYTTDPSFASRRLSDLPDSRIGYSGFVAKLSHEADSDDDGMSDEWETRFGFNPTVDDATRDDDGDGITNIEEFNAGTHPRGLHRRYFAEGAVSSFFTTRVHLFNPFDTTATVVLMAYAADGKTATRTFTIEGLQRTQIVMNDLFGGASAEFMTVIESDVEIVASRDMRWGSGGYGSHAETAIATPSSNWYFAEGIAGGGFETFFLVGNPSDKPADVEITYLYAGGASPQVHRDRVEPLSRKTVRVDHDASGAIREFGAIVRAANNVPVVVERAVYRSDSSGVFQSGHVAAGQTALDTDWTIPNLLPGPFFDSYLLLANPAERASAVTVTYVVNDGSRLVRTYHVPATARVTISIEAEAPGAVAALIGERDGRSFLPPIIVERVSWWPGSVVAGWLEAGSGPPIRRAGARWAIPTVEIGGRRRANPYLHILNVSDAPANVDVTVRSAVRNPARRSYVLDGWSRQTISPALDFPEAVGTTVSVSIDAQNEATPIAVELSAFDDGAGVPWSAGGIVTGARVDADAPRLTRYANHVPGSYIVAFAATPVEAVAREIEREYGVVVHTRAEIPSPTAVGMTATDEQAIRVSRDPRIAGVWEDAYVALPAPMTGSPSRLR